MERALRYVRRDGATCIPDFLTPVHTARLMIEVADAQFKAQEQHYLKAEQRIASYVVKPPFAGYPLVRGVAEALAGAAQLAMPPIGQNERYYPNHVSVHRYPEGEVGITPHYDEKKYGFMVASLTLEGSAEFAVVEDPERYGKLPPERVLAARRAAPTLRRWQTKSGSLVLLRAPGFDGVLDGRPLHRVSGGQHGPRTALVFRMDAARAQ